MRYWSSDVCSSDLIGVNQIGEIIAHLGGSQRCALPGHHIFTVLEEFGRSAVERKHDIVTRLETGFFNRRHNEVKRILGRGQRRCETAFISHGCRQTLRSEEHTSELQSLMRISYAVFCLKKKKD